MTVGVFKINKRTGRENVKQPLRCRTKRQDKVLRRKTRRENYFGRSNPKEQSQKQNRGNTGGEKSTTEITEVSRCCRPGVPGHRREPRARRSPQHAHLDCHKGAYLSHTCPPWSSQLAPHFCLLPFVFISH